MHLRFPDLNVQDDDKPGDQKPKGKKRPKSDAKAALELLSHLKKWLLFFWPPEVAGFKKRSKNRPRKPAKKRNVNHPNDDCMSRDTNQVQYSIWRPLGSSVIRVGGPWS